MLIINYSRVRQQVYSANVLPICNVISRPFSSNSMVRISMVADLCLLFSLRGRRTKYTIILQSPLCSTFDLRRARQKHDNASESPRVFACRPMAGKYKTRKYDKINTLSYFRSAGRQETLWQFCVFALHPAYRPLSENITWHRLATVYC
jgi:hypothetical protein